MSGRDDLLALKELIEAGKVRPVIDRTYRFDEIPEGIRYVESGAAAGKVVVTCEAGLGSSWPAPARAWDAAPPHTSSRTDHR